MKTMNWALGMALLVIVGFVAVPHGTVAEDAISQAVPVPVAWVGTPEIVGTRIEVDAPEITANETSYTQTVRYRQIVEYEVQVGISAE